jgi:hypothetical protein
LIVVVRFQVVGLECCDVDTETCIQVVHPFHHEATDVDRLAAGTAGTYRCVGYRAVGAIQRKPELSRSETLFGEVVSEHLEEAVECALYAVCREQGFGESETAEGGGPWYQRAERFRCNPERLVEAHQEGGCGRVGDAAWRRLPASPETGGECSAGQPVELPDTLQSQANEKLHGCGRNAECGHG